MRTTMKQIDIRPYTQSELAAMYGVSTKTLRNWILPHQETIGKRVGRLYTTKQVELIFDKLGIPG
jgi:DNA-binding transcriptional MerR regulator